MEASTEKVLNILLLEDVETDAELIARELEKEGLMFTPHCVSMRPDFEEALEEFSPDVILADYALPSFDGLSALEIASERCPNVPVVFVSGAIGEERAIETLKQGAIDYVLKDRLSRLGPAVRRALREAEEHRARKEAEAALRRAHDELEQKVEERTAELLASEKYLASIINSAIDAIINIDDELRITLFNQAAEKTFRCPADDAEGSSIKPLLTAEFMALLDEYVQTHTTTHGGPREGLYVAASEGLKARRSGGETFPVEATLSTIEDADQRRYLLILRDVDDRVRAQEELAHLESEARYLREELMSEYNFEEIVGISPAIQRVFNAIEQVAHTDTTVLIRGETGTGKELVARALHDRSSRASNTLVKVNCAALSSELIESELFGHEKGAFTGASSRRTGRFELAENGTLFLDEVGELPLQTQAKLLRALQEKAFERVGGTKTIEVDVRILAATNRDLETDVRNGRFRSDLYYRLNIFPIEIPPLRERREDIPLLAEHFRNRFARRMGKHVSTFSPSAMAVLKRYDWPGNVRELANIIERAVILTKEDSIRSEHLAFTGGPISQGGDGATSFATLEEAERNHIIDVLKRTKGVVGGPDGAAALLDINRTTLLSRMERLGIDASTYRE